MKIVLDEIGEVEFEKAIVGTHFGIEVYGSEAFQKIQTKSLFEITSAAFIKSLYGWSFVAELDVPEFLSILYADDYITVITDKNSIQKLNAFLYDS